MGNKELLIKHSGRNTKTVLVPSWNDKVTISALTLKEDGEIRDGLLDISNISKGEGSASLMVKALHIKLLSFSILDDDGNRAYSIDDFNSMSKQPQSGVNNDDALAFLIDEIWKFNGYAAGSGGDEIKNSKATQET